MYKSLNVSFDKLLHDTGKAILVKVNGKKHWFPKKLCRNLHLSHKLSGSVSLPIFLVERNGIPIDRCTIDKEVTHHVPIDKSQDDISYDQDLFN